MYFNRTFATLKERGLSFDNSNYLLRPCNKSAYSAVRYGGSNTCLGLKVHHTFTSGNPDFLFIASLCYCPFWGYVIILSLYIFPVYDLLIMIFDVIYLIPCFLVLDSEFSSVTLRCRIRATVKITPQIGRSLSFHVPSYSLFYSTVRLLATAFRTENSELRGNKHIDGQNRLKVASQTSAYI